MGLWGRNVVLIRHIAKADGYAASGRKNGNEGKLGDAHLSVSCGSMPLCDDGVIQEPPSVGNFFFSAHLGNAPLNPQKRLRG
jgi:hypothetical protein